MLVALGFHWFECRDCARKQKPHWQAQTVCHQKTAVVNAKMWFEFRFGMVPSCRSLLKVHAIQRILRTPCTAEKIIRKLPLNGSVSYSTAAANSILHDSQFFALMKDRWKPDSDKFKTVPVCFSCFCSLWFSVAPTTVCSDSALQEFNLTKNIFRAMKQNANGPRKILL